MRTSSRPIVILACTQIVAWGQLYYAFGVFAPHVQADMGWNRELVYGAYSWALLVAGLTAAPVGALLDRHGGRAMMGLGSAIAATGLALLALTQHVAVYLAAWTLIGLAMGLTLYEAAFATLNRKFAADARAAISTVTLSGGFASTLFWPVTQLLDDAIGWRATCWVYAATQLAVCLPLHLWLGADPPRVAAKATEQRGHTLAEAMRQPAFWRLAIAFSANAFVFAALTAHLIPLLQTLGHGVQAAVALGMLIGPMQVAGRVLERTAGRAAPPRMIGIWCFASLPAAMALLAAFGTGAWAAAACCILCGLSNGVLTIVRGTLPREMFGAEHYGAIAGALAGPALLARAAGPIIGAAVLARGWPPFSLPALLCATALASLYCYLGAVGVRQGAVRATLRS